MEKLGLAVIAGWKMWQGSQRETAEQASLVYHQLAEAVQARRVATPTEDE